MRHNCPKCGNRFEGNVCPECNTAIETKAQRQARALSKFEGGEVGRLSEADRNKNKKVLIVMCILGIALVLFVLWRNGFIGSSKYESVIENYFLSICERDFDKYTSCLPERIALDYESEMRELGYDKEQYMSELYSDYFAEFGSDMGVTLEIGKSEAVEQVYINYFLESYHESYGTELDYSNFIEVDVSAVFFGSNSTDTILLECFLMKDGADWYMVGCDYVTEDVA